MKIIKKCLRKTSYDYDNYFFIKKLRIISVLIIEYKFYYIYSNYNLCTVKSY